MKHASCRELYRYWDRIRAGDPAPQRTAIEPADIRTILCDTFILKVDGEKTYPFRLAGTRLCAAFGRELKGKSFVDLWDSLDRGQIDLLLSAVCDDARAAVVGVTAHAHQQRAVPLEMLLLPLRQNGPRYDRILGVLAPMELPHWLGFDPITAQAITSARLIWPDDNHSAAAKIGLQPNMEMPPPTSLAARRRERFVVFEGGKSKN